MTVVALGVFLIFFLWGFMPLRALFPYLVLPIIAFAVFYFLILFSFGGF